MDRLGASNANRAAWQRELLAHQCVVEREEYCAREQEKGSVGQRESLAHGKSMKGRLHNRPDSHAPDSADQVAAPDHSLDQRRLPELLPQSPDGYAHRIGERV